jgi:hypothetical protein
MHDQALEDRDHLRRRFAGAEDGFRGAAPERAVMIDLGESQIFERQVAKPGDRGFDVDAPGAEILEEGAEGFSIHRSLSISG